MSDSFCIYLASVEPLVRNCEKLNYRKNVNEMERALGRLKKIIGWIIAEQISHFGNVEWDVVTQKSFSYKAILLNFTGLFL